MVQQGNEDIRLIYGGRGQEEELPSFIHSPTVIVNDAWDAVKTVALRSLDAYLAFCKKNNLDHSYILGLDILITGHSDPTGAKVVDIRPTILEGPCCNSYPACPNIWANRLYRNALLKGLKPDRVEYPTHPEKILEKIVSTYLDIWKARGSNSSPNIAVFTRPYPESEEETAHELALQAFKDAGVNAFRITPDENLEVKNGKIHVDGVPIDMVHRRIERIHVPYFYGQKLGYQIINDTPNTIWINPWKIDDLRSKTLEEKCFREWESAGGKPVSRPIALLGKEINPESVKKLLDTGGYALKKWNSTGGKGVFLHLNDGLAKKIFEYLYHRYDGLHMELLNESNYEKFLKEFEEFNMDASIQQLRIIDSRQLDDGDRLAYDTRINVIYNELSDSWDFLSGMSRVVKCGKNVKKGNSILTNVTSGANIAPLIMGYTDETNVKDYTYGPLLSALMEKKTVHEIS